MSIITKDFALRTLGPLKDDILNYNHKHQIINEAQKGYEVSDIMSKQTRIITGYRLVNELEVFMYQKMLSSLEIDALMEEVLVELGDSIVTEQALSLSIHKSVRGLLAKILSRFASITKVPIRDLRNPVFIKMNSDSLMPINQMDHGDGRLILFINDDAEGGFDFPFLNFRLRPTAGSCLFIKGSTKNQPVCSYVPLPPDKYPLYLVVFSFIV